MSARRNISKKLRTMESNRAALTMFDILSQNCIFYISPMYEFSYRLGPTTDFPPWGLHARFRREQTLVREVEAMARSLGDLVPRWCGVRQKPAQPSVTGLSSLIAGLPGGGLRAAQLSLPSAAREFR